MIKATVRASDGRTVLVVGLSFGNLDKFRAEPGDTYIRINGADVGGLPVDVLLFSGETEAHLHETIKDLIGPETKVNISGRSRQ